jgi:hypothetical protein
MYWNANKSYRDADNVSGDDGEEMIQSVWHEIVNALREEVPEVLEIVSVSKT